MPPKIKIKKEDIIAAAYEIVKNEGLSKVNARKIAQELNCSVQPIFSNFNNMEDLKKEVIALAYRQFFAYMTASQDQAYKTMGLNYIAFAINEPKVFELLFMSEKNLSFSAFYKEMIPDFHYIAQSIEMVGDIPPQRIQEFHRNMWIFVHGIATLLVNRTIQLSWQQIETLLEQQFQALLLFEKQLALKED